jgi:hypothetical protein
MNFTAAELDEIAALANIRGQRAEAFATAAVTAAQLKVPNAQVGTSYTLALVDSGETVTLTNAGAITLTVPANATIAFSVGAVIDIAQGGAGLVTVAPAGGVTINSLAGALDLAGQYAVARLLKTATNTWILSGDIA